MSDGPEEKIAELRTQVARLEWVVIGMALSVLGFFSILALISTGLIPRFENIFAEMLGSQPLPMITRWCISAGRSGLIGGVAFLVPLGTAIYLILKPRVLASWITVFLTILFLIFMSTVVYWSLWLPFFEIVRGLQEGSD
ncbi:MAG: hypothetical protein KDN19_10610 [Verrucomicrobiae bacterium]|nr:hypothetical protein [Verrucomicrobiae bacterium]